MLRVLIAAEQKSQAVRKYPESIQNTGAADTAEVSSTQPAKKQKVKATVDAVAAITSHAELRCHNCKELGHIKPNCPKPERSLSHERKDSGNKTAKKKNFKDNKGKLPETEVVMTCSNCTTNANSASGQYKRFSNNSSVEIVYKEERRSVTALIDTGAVAGNYINSSVASWLTSLGYKASLERSKICSCTGDCTVANRKVFNLNVNNEKLKSTLFLRFVEFNTPYEMIIGLNDTMTHRLMDSLIIEITERITQLDTYIHPPTENKISVGTKLSIKQVTAPKQLQLTDQSNFIGPTVRKTTGSAGVMTPDPIVTNPSGLATDNLKSVGVSPKLASFKAVPEQRTSTLVKKPCCAESRQHSVGDRVADGCTICSLRVRKEELLDYEPEGDEVELGEQEDFFEAFSGERAKQLAGTKYSPTKELPPAENIHGSANLRSKILSLCDKYSAVFSTTVQKNPAKVTAMHLNVDDAKWKIPASRRAPRRQSADKQESLKEDLDTLLRLGVIRYSTAQDASQVLLVRKKDSKSWRLCIDFRELNSCTQPEQWPLPNIKELLERIGSHRPKFFGVLDMTSGYWQTPIAEASRKYTAFTTTIGNFEWCRVAMGLKAACAYFQRVMTTQVLIGLIHRIVESYLDDLIVFAQTEEAFLANLEELFQRLLKANITLNPNKCRLGMEEIEYVGHTINCEGIHFSKEKLKSAQEFKTPTTHRELKSFLGLANYFRDHIRHYAEITSPLHDLSNGVTEGAAKLGYRPNKPIDWLSVPNSSQAFKNIKEEIGNCTNLFFYDNFSPVFVMTDASEIGYGAYFFQRVEKLVDMKLIKVDQVIQIFSRT